MKNIPIKEILGTSFIAKCHRVPIEITIYTCASVYGFWHSLKQIQSKCECFNWLAYLINMEAVTMPKKESLELFTRYFIGSSGMILKDVLEMCQKSFFRATSFGAEQLVDFFKGKIARLLTVFQKLLCVQPQRRFLPEFFKDLIFMHHCQSRLSLLINRFG